MQILNSPAPSRDVRIVLFDFDGTLSLIRSGWMQLMSAMMMEELIALRTGEDRALLLLTVEDVIWRLTGKDTILQMSALADLVRERNGVAKQPQAYLEVFALRLAKTAGARVEELRQGAGLPEKCLMPGARAFIEFLYSRGLQLYLASGTDESAVREEMTLLALDSFFEGRIYGAKPSANGFSKLQIIHRITHAIGFEAQHLVSFGDGPAETESVHAAGATTVGIAGLEPECLEMDPWKCDRLAACGADILLPNFLHMEMWAATVLGSNYKI